MQIIDKSFELTFHILDSILPEIDWLLDYVEQNNGWLNLSELLPELTKNITAWDLPMWATFYLDEKRMRTLSALFLYDLEELQSITDSNKEQFRLAAKELALELLESADIVELPSASEMTDFFDNASESEKARYSKQMMVGIYSFFTTTFNYLSLMTFGKTLCQLVLLAQQGDAYADKYLCMAIQIDRTILYLPFVQTRIMKAQLGNDSHFLEQLANHIKRPILSGKIRYRKLWLTFAILEDEGFLDMPQEQLLDVLEKLGVYGKDFGVEDVGHLRNRLFEYRKKSALGKKVF